MSIKPINSVRLTEGEPAEATGLTPEQEAQLESWIADEQAAIEDLNKCADYYEYLSMEDQAKIDALKLRLRELISRLEHLLETGEWLGAGDPFASEGLMTELPEMESGWHASGFEIDELPEGHEDYDGYEQDVEAEGSTLEGVITVPNLSGNPDMDSLTGPALGFVIKDEDKVKKVTGETRGNDIWVTVEYDRDGDGVVDDKKTWILRGLATRTDVMLYISGMGCENGYIADFSRVIRINTDPYNFGVKGDTAGVILIGSEGDDILIGTQNKDTIAGGQGNDWIHAMAGDDNVIGDDAIMGPGGFLLPDRTGGDDYIYGGAGFDTIQGGGGNLDMVVQDNGEPGGVEFPGTWEESEMFKDLLDRAAADRTAFVNEIGTTNGWEPEIDPDTGEIVVRKNGDEAGGEITIGVPAGYTMAYAENEPGGSDIIITFTKIEYEDGKPVVSYVRVRLVGVNASAGDIGSQTTIRVDSARDDSIIDFSRCYAAGNRVIVNGSEGDDLLLGPKTNLDDLNVKGTDIRNGKKASRDEMEAVLGAYLPEGAEGWERTVWGGNWVGARIGEENGEIVLQIGNGEEDLDINFEQPAGFDNISGVFYEVDPATGDVIVYILQTTDAETGEFKVLKVRITCNGEHEIIGRAEEFIKSISVVGGGKAKPLGSVMMTGGGGENLLAGFTSSANDWVPDAGDTVRKGWADEPDSGPEALDPMGDADGDGVRNEIEMLEGTEHDPARKPSWYTEPEGDGEGGGEGGEGGGED